MNKTIFVVLITVLLSAGVFSQPDGEKYPLDISRFVKSAETEAAVANAESTKPSFKRPYVDKAAASTEVAFRYSYQGLSNGRGSWHEGAIDVVHRFSRRKVLYGSFAETERFKQRDRQAGIGFYQPLSEKWTLLTEASASPTHRVLPKWSAMAQLERSFQKGWIVHAGYRRTEHAEAKVNIVKLGAEKYWGLNRAFYSISMNNLERAGTSPSQRVQYNRYYGDSTSNIGVSFAFGREIEKVSNAAILQSDIYNVSVSGRHAVRKNWAIDYGYTFHKQGQIYNRSGLSIGIRYRF